MSYTIMNLREVDDMAPRFGLDSIQEAHFARGALEAEQTGLAFHVIKPNQRGGAHRHDEAEEIFVVLGGNGNANLDGEIVALKPFDAIRVAPKVVRAFEGGPDGLELLVFGPHHDGDGELLGTDIWDS
jgi:quercetin dioxygenase-like cupin family protein